MKMVLCVPCAEGLRAAGGSVKALTGKSMKITCEGCGRRRFGLAYNVASKPSRTARMDGREDGSGPSGTPAPTSRNAEGKAKKEG